MTFKQRLYLLCGGLLLTVSVISQSAMALSLGEINVRSNFAEPLIADIALPAYTADEIGSIEVHLASAKQHETMGYELTTTSKQLRFSVKENNQGALYIEVRTKSAVKELSLSLLLEVTSVNGRIIKGYDILLSPKAIPHTHEQQATATEKDKTSVDEHADKHSDKSSGQQSDKHSNKQSSNQVHNKVRALESGGFEYRGVGAGESLSRIAQRIRPDKSMHMYQVMIALYNENPDAFLDGNINKLQAGSNLKLINIDKIKDIRPSKAFSLIQKYAMLPAATEANDAAGMAILTGHSTEDEALSDEMPNEDVILSANIGATSNINSQLEKAKTLVDDLDIENKNLRERIAALEMQINKASEDIFSPQIAPSMTSVTSTPLAASEPKNEISGQTPIETNTSFMAEYQTIISLAAAGLLIIALVAMRKKKEILGLLSR